MKTISRRGLKKMVGQDYIIMKLNLLIELVRDLKKEDIHQRNQLEDLFLTIEEIKKEQNEKD